MTTPDPVFRFGIIRAPEPPPVRISVRPDLDLSTFGVELRLLRRDSVDRDPIVERVEAFLDSDAFDGDPESVPLHDQLMRMAAMLETRDPPLFDAVMSSVVDVFGTSASGVSQTPDYEQSRTQVVDALLALKIGHTPLRTSTNTFADMFRLLELIRVAAQEPDSLDGITFAEWMRAPVQLPDDIYPLPPRNTGEDDEPITDANAPDVVAIERVRQELRDIDLAEEEILTVRAIEPVDRSSDDRRLSRPAVDNFVIAEREATRISEPTRNVLASIGADAVTSPFFGMLDSLEAARNASALELRELAAQPTSGPRLRIGTTTLPVPAFPGPDDIAIPEAPHSPVSPAGVMDLLVTRAQLKRYEGGDVSYIHNVLQSESSSRETRRLRRTEETFTVEREETITQEQDLQVAERQEIRREVESKLSEEQNFKLGFKLGAKYGPIVTEANTEFEVSSSSEQASKTATSFAKELTQSASEKATTRIREEQTIRTLEEFEEKNSHGFDNTNGDGNISGAYEWVNKVQELQIYSFGIRLMFNLVLPNPGAFLLRTLELELASSESVSAPVPIDFTAADISLTNYQELAARYDASVEAPPAPYKTVSQVFAREGSSTATPEEEENEDEIVHLPASAVGASVNIPAGYVAFGAWVNAQAAFTGPDTPGIELPRVTMQIGQIEIENLQSSAAGDIDQGEFVLLNLERSSIPVAVMTRSATVSYATAEIWCIRSWRALEDWKLRTYDALVQAFRQRQSEYDEKIAEAAAREGIQIPGRNPIINRKIESEEIQRLAIKMITNESFADTHTNISGFNRLAFNVQEANRKGRFARFWKAALDWDNVTYEALPYFWSKKGKTWRDKLLMDDTDPEHATFLKAGALDLLVAVNPGHERDVLNYLDSGEIPSGGDMPAITNPRFAALLADIEKNRDQQLTEEVPVGEPWDITLPTTLVRLRDDSSLPAWEKDEDGNWHPVESGNEPSEDG